MPSKATFHSLEKHGEPVPGPVTEAIIEVPV